MWLILGIALGLLVIDFLFRVTIVLMVTPMFERQPAFSVVRAEPQESAECVSFSSGDGLTLRGSLYHGADPRGVVVFCPEFDGNHWTAMRYAVALWQAGYALLAFDFRNQGESDAQPDYKPLHWLTEYEVSDLQAAIDFVQSRPGLAGLPLGVFGISRGGAAALAVASRRSDVAWVVCDSIPPVATMMTHYARRWAELYVPHILFKLLPEWHIRSTLMLVRQWSQYRRRCRYTVIEPALAKLSGRPVLMISGDRDSYVKPEIIRPLARRIGSSCQFWVVAGARHNEARSTIAEEYDRRIVEFVAECDTGAL